MSDTPTTKPKTKVKTPDPKDQKKQETDEIDTSILGWGLARRAGDDIKKRKAENKKMLDEI